MKSLLPFPTALASVAFSLALSGCGQSRLPHPRWVSQPTAALREVPYPPPPARTEFVPDQPDSRALWIDGEWTWGGRRWAWRAGRWVVPPVDPILTTLRLPAAFSPWVTVRNGEGTLFFAEGTWRDGRGGEILEPTPLALGTANETDSSNPDSGAGDPKRRLPDETPTDTSRDPAP